MGERERVGTDRSHGKLMARADTLTRGTDVLQGAIRGLAIVSLQAANVVAIQWLSVLGTFLASGAIAVVWLMNVESASLSRAHRIGFVLGSAFGSAFVVTAAWAFQ